MRGLIRLTNAANKLEAWRDFHTLAREVEEAGYADLADRFIPALPAGWRKIDQQTAALREAFHARHKQEQHEHPTE